MRIKELLPFCRKISVESERVGLFQSQKKPRLIGEKAHPPQDQAHFESEKPGSKKLDKFEAQLAQALLGLGGPGQNPT